MNERNAKNYVIVKTAYSERLKKIVQQVEIVGMVELLGYIEKAKTASQIVYSLVFPNGSNTILAGRSERQARSLCRAFAEYMEARREERKADELLVDIYNSYIRDAKKAENSDSAYTVFSCIDSAHIWMD
jgi:hypothetical protein